MTRIIGIIGTLGKGKTLAMTKYAYQIRKMYAKKIRIISNYELKIADEIIDPTQVDNLLDDETKYAGSLLLIDEFPAFVDSRESMSKHNKNLSNFLRHLRKLEIEFVYSSQFFDQVDKRVRAFTNEIWLPEPLGYDWYRVSYRLRTEMGWTTKFPSIFFGMPLYSLYDTKQIIKRKPILPTKVRLNQ